MKPRYTPLMAAILAAVSTPSQAEEAQATQALPTVVVQDTVENEYKPEKAASPKYTAPLRDTPQSVQVIPKKVIEEQGQLTLRDMLSNVPGITFGAAEGGNGFGDNITLRGVRIDNDIQVDGIRDSAQTARVDPFNLEQLEVVKGASSVYSGAGAIGGTINMVSKTAKADEFIKLTAGVGTDNYARTTIDANHMFNDSTALRLNLMAHKNDSPDRDEVWFERWGAAASLAFGLGTDTRLTLNYIHQDNTRVPDRGIPWRRVAGVPGQPLPVDKSTYWGWSNVDREDAVVDAFTAIIENDISDLVKLRNATRVARTENTSTFAKISGLICVDGNPFVESGTCTPGETSFNMTEPVGNLRDDVTKIITNVTDFTWSFNTGPVAHTLVTGLGITAEDFERVGMVAVGPNGQLLPSEKRTSFDPIYRKPYWFVLGGSGTSTNANQLESELRNVAVYAFETAKFNEQWSVNAGLRYERNEVDYVGTYVNRNTGLAEKVTPADAKDELISARVGVVFKPVEAGSIYAAVGNSMSPASNSLLAGCIDLPAGNTCDIEPEETINYELGSKWDLFGAKLAVNGALFRNERNKIRVASANTNEPQQLDGKNYVQGVELGASGKITDQWAVSAAYAFLDSEVQQSKANGVADLEKGYEVPGIPEHSGNVWTTYLLPGGFELGYGIRYVGNYKTESLPSTKTAVIPSSTQHNAMIGYQVNKDLSLRLNLNNLSDETVWNSVRSNGNGWGHPGEGRSAVLTLNYNVL